MIKTAYLITSILCFNSVAGYTQNVVMKNDTIFLENNIYMTVDELGRNLKKYDTKISMLQAQVDSLSSQPSYAYFYQENPETAFQDLKWIAPVVLFIFIVGCFTSIIIFLYRTKFDLKAALSEIKVVELNDGSKATKEKISVESSSRLVIFFSAITAIFLSVTMILISIHVYLKTGIVPEFESLINGMIALGIGVIPYTVNKIAGTFRSGTI